MGCPNFLGTPRFPVVLVVPMTTYRNQSWANNSPKLYPVFNAGIASLRSSSIALLDQVRVVDVKRIINYRGSLTDNEYKPIKDGLREMFDL